MSSKVNYSLFILLWWLLYETMGETQTANTPSQTSTTQLSPTSSTPLSLLQDPMTQLFGIVLILFVLTVILGTVNFCIFCVEKRRRRGPVQWQSAPIGDSGSSSSRPANQAPKRSFHIQHALYKNVRRPSSMPPWVLYSLFLFIFGNTYWYLLKKL